MRRTKAVFLALAVVCGLADRGFAAEDCSAVVSALANLRLTDGVELMAQADAGKSFKTLYGECDTGNRFAGRPLPSFRGRPLKCSTDKNHVEFVRKFPEGTVVFRAKMSVDADGSPASMGPNHSPTDQAQTWLTFDNGSDRHFVNAEEVPFVVVPLPFAREGVSFMRATGVRKGDLAVAVKGERCSFGVVGDAGPYFRLGEGSIRAHLDLGNEQCRIAGQHPCEKLKNGGSGVGIAAGVTYMIFPGTRPVPLLSQTVVSVARTSSAARAKAFLERFSD
jgi:hypothetical protein